MAAPAPHAEPAAAHRRPGAGLLPVRDAVRAPLLPPGRRRRGYQAQAASQSVRDIVVQPQRGLIVDDQGRPLVANRTSWVVSIDRNLLDKLAERQRTCCCAACRWSSVTAAPGIAERLVTCGDEGACAARAGTARPTSPCRSPATSAGHRAAHPRAARGLSRRCRRAAERPRLPPPVRGQPRARARLPQPDHRGRVRRRRRPTTTSRSTAPRASGGPASRSSTTQWLRGMPGYRRVAVDSMGRVLGDDGTIESIPATRW